MTLPSLPQESQPPEEAPDGGDSAGELLSALARYREGASRRAVFHDLVAAGIPERGATLLDIGCGHGFDHNHELQQSLAARAEKFIGIEPDPEIIAPDDFNEVHCCTFEEAPLEPASFDVAYAAFVLEHLQQPELFWSKLYNVLKPGGIFWGFTVDARHPFCFASLLLDRLRVKDLYLNRLRGERGATRYENYPTFYRANSPKRLRQQTEGFSRTDLLSMHREGQLNYYFPKFVRPIVHVLERWSIKWNLPGSMLVVRLEK